MKNPKKIAKFIAVFFLLLAIALYYGYPKAIKWSKSSKAVSSTSSKMEKQWTLCIKLECNAKPVCSKANVSIDPKNLRILYTPPGTKKEAGFFKATSEDGARYDGDWEWTKGDGEFYLEKISSTLYKGAWRDPSSNKISETKWEGHELRLTQSPI